MERLAALCNSQVSVPEPVKSPNRCRSVISPLKILDYICDLIVIKLFFMQTEQCVEQIGGTNDSRAGGESHHLY